ncbi:Stress responsive alpha-beta barrel [Macleaya cordata]|uniref:Stress responsive alpha-beta barrel n=1 Tax=Macleaya cordata TaxID=56857 RepID=A0A200PML2_MACCD|nr:Stress responsive alpha-beta barrel [Macleaya cordata]
MSAKSQTIEHVVLFNVKDETDSTKINSMITNLNSLTSLDQVLHLTAGPILRNRSSSFKFTHLLHSRYKSKEDLNGYAIHPNHLSVVKESVLPICDDIMAVDWVSDLEGPMVVKSGSAMRLTFLKLKEDLGENEKGKVLDVIGGIKDRFDSIDQISFGENFSARAKGFSIASVAVFPGLSELDGLDSSEEMVKEEKEKVKDLLESVIVLDYVVPASKSANL